MHTLPKEDNASASPTGTRPPCSSLLLPWSNASHKCLSHWDSATMFQLAPPMEQCFAQVSLPLGLGHHVSACSSHGATLRTSDSPTGTQPLSCSLLPWSNASRKCLSHWDSAIMFQLALPIEKRFAQVPSPTGTRPTSCSSLLPWRNASRNNLSQLPCKARTSHTM
ncbi:hypothetical protein Adt_34360 [Abeliophyllum distichum]|uniref:Uncharacterized protein n=1 Tax=Abeliophyllum distichum TaxID=126358 RepID=A0ABD1QZW6_9LAMI